MIPYQQTILNLPVLRLCNCCKVEKSISDFYQRYNNHHQCKSCERKKQKAHRDKLKYENPVLYRARNSHYRERSYEKIFHQNNKEFFPDGRKNRIPSSNDKIIRPKNFNGKDYRYRKKYNLSYDDVKMILSSQMGLCANRTCGKEIFLCSDDKKTMAVVDHCHKSGEVRGMLCHVCNVALGYLENKDRVLGLTEYLNKNLTTT